MKSGQDHGGSMRRRDFVRRFVGASFVARNAPLLMPLAAGGARGAAIERDPVQEPLYWSWWGWEPLAHYRRAGGVVGAVDTKAPGLERWYDRLHSEEIVRKMADIGVNLGITHFFKGFGLMAEREEQKRTAALVKIAHEHGVKVLGYCQSRSLYHETFLAEEPRAEAWISLDEKGKLRTWGRSTYRWAPCILSREFRDYMKRAIRVGLEEVNLDGLHFDNDYFEPCYCKRCEEGFRAWLVKRHPSPQEEFGMASFDGVRLPVVERSPARIDDRITQEWVRFRCESLAGYHAELCGHARSIKPRVILLGNPAYPRDGNTPHGRSVWPVLLGRQLDLLFAENQNFPGMDGEALVSQIRAFKRASAVGYRVISTVWRHNKETGLGLPEKPAEVVVQVAEAVANGGIPGTNWALRPTNVGDGMRIDRADLRDALAQSLRFAKEQWALAAGARPVKDIAVLHTFASSAFDCRESDARVLATEEVLIRGGFAWETVFGEDMGRLEGFTALVLAGQSHMSDEQCGAVRAFAKAGGVVILVGENGVRDENGRPRPNPILDGVIENVVRVDPTAICAKVPVSQSHIVLPEGWMRAADTIDHALADRLNVRALGSNTVAVTAREKDRRLMIHLVNYGASPTPGDLSLRLGKRWQNAATIQMRTIDGAIKDLRAGDATIEIPPFAVHAVLLIG